MSTLFKNEPEFQEWLASELNAGANLGDLIFGWESFNDVAEKGWFSNKIIRSFENCRHSLYTNVLISEDEDIFSVGRKKLKPDFLLFDAETANILVVEIKNTSHATREAGTESSAYANGVKVLFPFLASGDIIHIIISSDWPTLLRNWICYEVIFFNKKLLCLQPVMVDGNIRLEVLQMSALLVKLNVAPKFYASELEGFHHCLYAKNAQTREKIDNLDGYVAEMKYSLQQIRLKAESEGLHGFSFLWKDRRDQILAPYSMTIVNVSPFTDPDFLLYKSKSILAKKIIQINEDFEPSSTESASLYRVVRGSHPFLKNFCNPLSEGFSHWGILHQMMTSYADSLIAFQGWGVFGEAFDDKMQCSITSKDKFRVMDPEVGLEVLNSLINESE
jgi:hypothetical protein